MRTDADRLASAAQLRPHSCSCSSHPSLPLLLCSSPTLLLSYSPTLLSPEAAVERATRIERPASACLPPLPLLPRNRRPADP